MLITVLKFKIYLTKDSVHETSESYLQYFLRSCIFTNVTQPNIFFLAKIFLVSISFDNFE